MGRLVSIRVKERHTVAQDELCNAGEDHGNATKEVKGTRDLDKRGNAGAAPAENAEHGGLEGDEETADTEEGGVTQALGEVTLCLGGLVEELLVLLGGDLDGDLAAEVLQVAVVHLHLLVDAVARHDDWFIEEASEWSRVKGEEESEVWWDILKIRFEGAAGTRD